MIGYNVRLGTFECAVVFDVVDPANNDHLDQSSSSDGDEKVEVEKVEAKNEVPEMPPKEAEVAEVEGKEEVPIAKDEKVESANDAKEPVEVVSKEEVAEQKAEEPAPAKEEVAKAEE